MKKIMLSLPLAFWFVGGFAGLAIAQTATDGDLIDLAKPVLESALAGDYWLAASTALVLLATAFARFAPKSWAWARSSAGRALTVLAISFGAALATTLATGASMTPAVAWAALKVAIGAAGGYSLFKATLLPLFARFAEKHGGFVGKVITFALKLVQYADPDKAAKEAGDEAVADDPPGGASDVTGEPGELK